MPSKNRFDLRVVCQLFYPELVSTGQTLTELVEELSNSGLRIKVVASQPTVLKDSEIVPKVINYNNIQIVRTWSTRFSKLSFLGKLTNLTTFFISASFEVLFKDRKVPLLLLTNPPYLALLGWLNYFFNRCNFGVILFDIMPEQAELVNVIKKNGLISKIWKYLNKNWYKKAKFATVLSTDMLEGAIDNAKIRGAKFEEQARNKTFTIHIWADDRLIKPIPKEQSSEAVNLNVTKKFVVQYSGNHGRFHDIETIIEIASKINDEDVVFQFIGEGYKKIFVDHAIQSNKCKNIYSYTYIRKNLLAESLAMADLGVVAQLPGQERVCYPSKLLGIMASGRAILAICPKDTEMAKMITDNNLGFVISNGDVDEGIRIINYAKANLYIVKQMGQNSLNYLKNNLTLKDSSLKYSNLIERKLLIGKN